MDVQNAILLNSARSCIRYIIRAYNIREIHIPFYTCPVVWQSIRQENCKIRFYHIDNDFLPTKQFNQDDFIIYTNYFGICAKNVKQLAKKYKNLIVDNAQAFYMPKYGMASFNSIRKFHKTADGAMLSCDKTTNQQYFKDIDCNYENRNEERINTQDILLMSDLTKATLFSIDLQAEKEKRLKNFYIWHEKLEKLNFLNINPDKDDIPMYYPCLIHKDETINVFSNLSYERLWNPMPIDTQEGIFQKYLRLLPLNI